MPVAQNDTGPAGFRAPLGHAGVKTNMDAAENGEDHDRPVRAFEHNKRLCLGRMPGAAQGVLTIAYTRGNSTFVKFMVFRAQPLSSNSLSSLEASQQKRAKFFLASFAPRWLLLDG